MRTATVVLAALAVFGPLASAAHADDEPGIARYLRIRTPSAPDLAADGSVYLRDWPDGVYQLYRRAPGEGPEAQGARLTDFVNGISGFTVAPDASLVLVTASSAGGSEQDDLYTLNPETGEVEALYVDPEVVYEPQVWLRDTHGFVFSANDVRPGDFTLWAHDLDTGERTKLVDEPGYWYAQDVTGDGSRYLVGRYYSASSAEVWELDATTGELTDLSLREPAEDSKPSEDGEDSQGAALVNFPEGYTPDEKGVLIVTDALDGFRKLYTRDLETGGMTEFEGLGDHDVADVVMNRERDLLAVTTNEDGFGVLHLFEWRDGAWAPVPLPAIEPGVVSVQDIEGRTLVYALSNARTPGIAYRWLVHSKMMPVPVTKADDQGFDFSTFTLPELVRYETFDGKEIPAFLYLPEGYERGTPIPFIVQYHGGPEGQHRPYFSSTTQYYLSAGYGVLRPNVRGSTGYGREFHRLDNTYHRWDSVTDGWYAAKWLVDNGYSQPGRIASMGGSYGGFMACAVPVEDTRQAEARGEPPLLGASIDIVGIVNFRTFLERTKDYRRKLREAEYGSLSDPDFLDSISPLTHVDQIRVPMLIAHGLNDPRVPIEEAMQLAEGLQRRGLDPEQVYFYDEGHGFRKLDNRLLFYDRAVRFLDQHIGGGKEPKR